MSNGNSRFFDVLRDMDPSDQRDLAQEILNDGKTVVMAAGLDEIANARALLEGMGYAVVSATQIARAAQRENPARNAMTSGTLGMPDKAAVAAAT